MATPPEFGSGLALAMTEGRSLVLVRPVDPELVIGLLGGPVSALLAPSVDDNGGHSPGLDCFPPSLGLGALQGSRAGSALGNSQQARQACHCDGMWEISGQRSGSHPGMLVVKLPRKREGP